LKSIIVFDIESNGFQNTSVLSISAIKAIYDKNIDDFKLTEKFNRYYYMEENEKENPHALKINNLTKENITKFRKNVDYPLYFKDDFYSFEKFSENTVLYVAHNIKFDMSFIPFIKKNNTFCTMNNNTYWNQKKLPSLKMTAMHYNVEIKDDNLHSSDYDTFLCFEIFKAMHKNRHSPLIKTLKRLEIK